MGETSSKKRKRDGEPPSKPGKRVVLDVPPPTVAVSSVLQTKDCPPVIATAPGIEVPKTLLFHAYQPRDEPRPRKQSKHAAAKELLLHSTAHRSIDLTAREEEPRGSGPLMKHYVGIYEPSTGRLEVIEAKKMVVRGQVRAKQAPSSSADDNTVKQSIADRKTDLGETFGTKKAKKAIREKVLNAISPHKKPGDNMATKIDNASRAMLESVGAITSQMATQEELQAAVDEAKPVPRANTEAKDIQDVYDPETVIGADILNLVPIREWQEKARHKEGILFQSQFVTARVNVIATDDAAVTRLRVLRYLGFLLLFYLITKGGKGSGTLRLLPSREELREKLAPAPEAVIENIRRKFSDGRVMRKFHVDLLRTHCCVFACIVDNFEVDTQNLGDDLRLEPKEMSQYFREIGARVKQVTNKANGKVVNVARLALPLQLPKLRRIASRRK